MAGGLSLCRSAWPGSRTAVTEGFVASPAAGSVAAVAGGCGAAVAGTASVAEGRGAVPVLTVCKSLSRGDPE